MALKYSLHSRILVKEQLKGLPVAGNHEDPTRTLTFDSRDRYMSHQKNAHWFYSVLKVEHLWAGEINVYMPTMYCEMLKNYIIISKWSAHRQFYCSFSLNFNIELDAEKKLINNCPQKLYTTVTNLRFRAGFGEAVRITTVRWEISKVCNRTTAVCHKLNS